MAVLSTVLYHMIVVDLWCNPTDVTPIVEGHRLYYNFIKPHMALDGRTPSEEAGTTIEGDNKWLTLMKKSIQYQKKQNTNLL